VISIKEVTEKQIWENFNLKSKKPSFLQSWAWGEFQKSLDREIFRLGVYESDDLVGICLVIEEKAKTASFFYAPAGPVLSNWDKEPLDSLLRFLRSKARERNLSFLRLDPRKIEKKDEQLLFKAGFLTAPEYVQPPCSALIDLYQSEQEILAKMATTTRYNIGASTRKNVKIREGGKEEVSIFIEFLKQTSKKHYLTLPGEPDYHKKQFDALSQEGLMKLFIAGYQGVPLAAALVVFYGDTAYYLHAANSYQQSKLRAAYPLVWHSILAGKTLGLKKFDFWGIAETDDPKHSWAGITAFKLSFGAEREHYQLPYDLPLKVYYRLVRLIETSRKPLRKLLKFVRKG